MVVNDLLVKKIGCRDGNLEYGHSDAALTFIWKAIVQ